ncbi:MAG: diaminopimelate decarboxylase, partial [Rikenellaceae bacterium]
CAKVNIIVDWFAARGITFRHINLGGGLGIDYENPDENPIVDFERYFSLFDRGIVRSEEQKLHFELGRSLVGQCGELITRVLYNKVSGDGEELVVVDAGMNDLMRPALYGAKHKIVNLSSKGELRKYTIVGPICESSDVFSTDIFLSETHRGDLLSIKSTGAYGASMASNYNMREIANTRYLE